MVATAGKHGRVADDIIRREWPAEDAKSTPEIVAMIERATGQAVEVFWVKTRAGKIGVHRHPAYAAKIRAQNGAMRQRGGNYNSQSPAERGEGRIRLPEWPEFKGRYADVGRLELLREMVPLDRFTRLPSVPMRHSGAGCSMAGL